MKGTAPKNTIINTTDFVPHKGMKEDDKAIILLNNVFSFVTADT